MRYMIYLTCGLLLLLGLCWVVYTQHESLRVAMKYSAGFTVLTYLMATWCRWCEWYHDRGQPTLVMRKLGGKPIAMAMALLGLFIAKAKAIILFAVVMLGLGLVAWGVIELVYDAMTVVPRIQRNDIVWNTKTKEPVLAARPVRLISSTPLEIHELVPGSPGMYRKVEGTKPLEYSADGVDWQPWQPTREIGQGLWRLR